jgi:lysophospholipase L1-like esterase
MTTGSKITLGISILLIVYVVAQYFRTRHYINIGVPLAARAVAYEQHPAEPTSHILVIGDSTAVGTGADRPEESTAGLLGHDYPEADIVNRGVNGARLADLSTSFVEFDDQEFDLVLVQIGGNDVWHFTRFTDIEDSLNNVLADATRVGKHVMIMHGGDFASAKALPLGTRWLFSWRSAKLRELYQRVVPEYGASYVDVWHANDNKPDRAAAFYAADNFHPSSSGYADWYAEIKLKLPQ